MPAGALAAPTPSRAPWAAGSTNRLPCWRCTSTSRAEMPPPAGSRQGPRRQPMARSSHADPAKGRKHQHVQAARSKKLGVALSHDVDEELGARRGGVGEQRRKDVEAIQRQAERVGLRPGPRRRPSVSNAGEKRGLLAVAVTRRARRRRRGCRRCGPAPACSAVRRALVG